MLKKLLFIFILIFSVFGFAACDGGETPDIDITESVGVPTNLAVNGKVLTWDAVATATGYIVYVNGEEKQTVTTTSYDFSSLSGDNLLFQVVAKAPKGTNDSVKSSTVAYMANPQAEITAINVVLGEMMGEAPEGVAEELVRKGMTGTQAQAMKAAFEVMQTEMDTAEGDPKLTNAAMKKFLATDMNIEAVAGAGLVMMLPQLDNSILNIQDEIDYYQDMIDEYGPDEYYESRVDEYTEQKQMMVDMKAMIEDSRDELALVVANTVNYLVDFQSKITDTLIDKIVDLVETEDTTQLSASEIIVVKDEVVDLLLDNLPASADLALVFKVFGAFAGEMLDNTDFSSLLTNASAQFSASTLLSIEFALKMIDSFDLAFFTDVLEHVNSEEVEQVVQSEIAILVISQVKEFKDANQALLDQIDAIFTDQQKEDLYNGYFDAMMELTNKYMGMSSMSVMVFPYATMISGSEVFEDMADKFLTKFVDSDGELLRKIVIANSFTFDYDYENWEQINFRNEATGEVYADEVSYYEAEQEANVAITKEAITYYAPTLGTLTNDQINSVIDMVVEGVPVSDLALQTGKTELEIQTIVDLAETLLRNATVDANTLLKNFMNYVVANDLITKAKEMDDHIENYYVTTYGEDYFNNPNFYDDEYERNYSVIFVAKHANTFFNSANKTLVENVITDIATFAKNEEIYSLIQMTLTEVTDMETLVNDVFDDLILLSATIKDYNAANLTAAQLLKIEEFLTAFESLGENDDIPSKE